MDVNELNDLEFSDLIKSVIARLEEENKYVTHVEIPYGDALIFIDNDDEISSQIPEASRRFGWQDFRMTYKIDKKINL